MRFIYFDHNATAPLHPAALQVWRSHLEKGLPQNPSSIHWAGQAARRALSGARETLAALLEAEPAELVFTSSGTEANALALRGALATAPPGRRRLLLSAVEHSSLLAAAASWVAERPDFTLERLAVTAAGTLDLEAAQRALGSDVALVGLMAANNETGALQPVRELSLLARAVGAPMLCDAAQAVGKVPVSFGALAVELLTCGGHKFGAGLGAGLLCVRRGFELRPQLPGHQERGRRAGTESVTAIAAAAAALEALQPELAGRALAQAALRDRLEAGARAAIAEVTVHAGTAPRLPQTSCLGFAGADGEALLIALDVAGIAASSGAACASGTLEPSHVLLAMGLSKAEASSAVRFSLGSGNRPDEVEELLQLLPALVEGARQARRLPLRSVS